jgi:Flp pilus assembly protein TadG
MPRAIEDHGSATVETVILAPVFALFLAFTVLAGRLAISHGDVDAAAHYAARAISIARSPSAVIDAAQADAEATLHVGSSTCRSMTFDAAITDTEVTVTIACVVDLSAAALLPVPGNVTVSDTATEPLDQFREDPTEFGISEGPACSHSSTESLS